MSCLEELQHIMGRPQVEDEDGRPGIKILYSYGTSLGTKFFSLMQRLS